MYIVRRTERSAERGTSAIIHDLRQACPGIDAEEIEMDVDERRAWLEDWAAESDDVATEARASLQSDVSEASDEAILAFVRASCGEDCVGIEVTREQLNDRAWMTSLCSFIVKPTYERARTQRVAAALPHSAAVASSSSVRKRAPARRTTSPSCHKLSSAASL